MKWRVLGKGLTWDNGERNYGIVEADRAVVPADTGMLCFLDKDGVLLEVFAPGTWMHAHRQEAEEAEPTTNCSAQKDDDPAT